MCLAIPGKVVKIIDENPLSRMADVSFSGAIKTISLAFVPGAKVGDYVIVHVGFAISILDEAEAAEVFHTFQELSESAGNEGGS